MVQFIVVAKGAERVAEVAARFTLDALPCKQMGIDAELRNGHIDQNEARSRRATLEKESQLYGAMDGAMKFVKGDAIAGLVVICVNMLGGITIGLLSKGMSFRAALHQYTLLTIGDALISQIPSLLLSITAATIITRVNGVVRLNLGTDIVNQLTANSHALRLSACVLVVMGAIPGFRSLSFSSWLQSLRQRALPTVGPKAARKALMSLARLPQSLTRKSCLRRRFPSRCSLRQV